MNSVTNCNQPPLECFRYICWKIHVIMRNFFAYRLVATSGRPLTKKTVCMDAVADTDDDEGYGRSPILTPNSSVQFQFNSTEEDVEWISLQKEINRTCFQVNQTNPDQLPPALPMPIPKTLPLPPPIKSSAVRPHTSICHFCAKNGEIRSVVINQMNIVLSKNIYFYIASCRLSRTCWGIRSLDRSSAPFCAGTFANCAGLQAILHTLVSIAPRTTVETVHQWHSSWKRLVTMQLAREIPVLTCSLTPSPPSLRSRFLLHYEIMKFLSGFFYIIL